MSKSITQDMRYRQSLMQYTAKYGVSRASREIVGCGDSFQSQLSVCFAVPQVNKITLRSVQNMASIRKRGSNSYLIVVSRGYDYEGNRLKSVQKTVKPPKEYTPKQAEKWVREQAILFEREVQHTPEPINRSITL